MKNIQNQAAKFGILALAIALCVPAAWAQQKDPRIQPVAPLPPASGESSSANAGTPGGPAPGAAQGDSTPLTSAQAWSPGSGSASRSFLLPRLSVYQGGDTNPQGARRDSEVSAVTTFAGHLTFHRVWSQNEFTSEYSGGGNYYTAAENRNRFHQDLRLAFRKTSRRWSYLLADTITYSPEGGAGGGLGFGQLGPRLGSLANNPLINLNSALQPSQLIVTTDSARVSNTVVGEFNVSPGRRSAMTFTGSYGVLRFLENGFINGDTIGFRAGYNHTLTARDTLAVSYGGSLFRFQNVDRRTNTHFVHLSYGRKISGRMAWQMAAGPQVSRIDVGSGTVFTLVSWSLESSLRYRLGQFDSSLSYQHGVTGGSGFFLGATTDDVRVGLSRQLSRLWRGSADFSFARNESLKETLAGLAGRHYTTWRGGFGLSRPLGRYTRMSCHYQVQRQTSTRVNCDGPTCGFLGTKHVFGLSFNFRFRSIELD